MNRDARRLIFTWVGLLALGAVSLGIANIPLGRFNMVIAMSLSVIMAALVITLFMRLFEAPYLAPIFAAAGVFFLTILLVIGGTDYLSRTVYRLTPASDSGLTLPLPLSAHDGPPAQPAGNTSRHQ